MSETMIAALITGAVAIAVCLINNIFQQRNIQKQHEKTVMLIEYKLSELTKRVDKHNQVIERTYALERKCDLYDEKFRVTNRRIDDFECDAGK